MIRIPGTLLPIITVACTAFVLHYLWESAHLVLYTNYGGLDTLGMPVTLWATCGDVLYTLAAYAGITLYKRDVRWVAGIRLRDIALLMTFGFGIALYVEYKALLTHAWAYTTAMPIIPLLHVGLSPILQMTFLLPLSCLFGTLAIRLMRLSNAS